MDEQKKTPRDEQLKLPWEAATAPDGGATYVRDCDGNTVRSHEQTAYAITAANQHQELKEKLATVERAYVYAARVNGAITTDEQILANVYHTFGNRIQPVSSLETPDPSGNTPQPQKTLPDPLNGPNLPNTGVGWYENLMGCLDVWENAFPKAPLGQYDPASCFKAIRQMLERNIGPLPGPPEPANPEPANPEAEQLDLVETAGKVDH